MTAEEIEIPAALAGVRVDRAVALLADVTRAEATALVDGGSVAIGGRVVSDRTRRLREHDRLTIDRTPVDAERAAPILPRAGGPVPFTVVYEDDSIIVVDKPAGVVVHPGAGNRLDTLAAGLLAAYPELAALPAAGVGEEDRPGIVHRLDKETSGLLVVARTPAAHRSLSAQLADHSMGRVYLALVIGEVEAASGVIDAPIARSGTDRTRMAVASGGRYARTHYRVVQRYSRPVPSTLLELELETGRTHQIRVHVAAIGHPVAGDRRYGGARGALPTRRPMLHAARLRLTHPSTGEQLVVESPLPEEFVRVLDSLA